MQIIIDDGKLTFIDGIGTQPQDGTTISVLLFGQWIKGSYYSANMYTCYKDSNSAKLKFSDGSYLGLIDGMIARIEE